jgi:DNA transposition AAA+ family ATPase
MNAPTLEAPKREVSPTGLIDTEEEVVGLSDELKPSAARPMPAINIGGHTVTKATEHLPEEQRTLIRWLYHHQRTHNLQTRELAAEVGLSPTTIWRLFCDQYRYPKEEVSRDRGGNEVRKPHPHALERISIDGLCGKIARYRRRAETSGRAANPDFVMTDIAERIFWLCERCGRNRRMGFIYGDGQIGKSFGLRQYAAEHNGGITTYVEMPPSSGVQFMLKCIGKALLVPTASTFDKLLEDVLEALDPSKLLLVDEIHRVFTTYQRTSVMRCLDTLRYIHDQTGCGLVLCGTNVFRDKVKAGEFMQYLKQLHRRGRSYELQLPNDPPRKDLDMIAAKFGLDPAKGDAEVIVTKIAKSDGIGVYRLRLLDAQDYARNKRQELNWGHFLKAYAITEKAARGSAAAAEGEVAG